MPEKEKVLVLDDEKRNEEFRAFLSTVVENYDFVFVSDVSEALQTISNQDIPVILVGGDVNGFLADELPELIRKETGKVVQVVLNCYKEGTCRIKRKEFLQSPIFDVIYPTTIPEKILKRISVALEAHKLEKFNFMAEEES